MFPSNFLAGFLHNAEGSQQWIFIWFIQKESNFQAPLNKMYYIISFTFNNLNV